jgi:hypothetical protein
MEEGSMRSSPTKRGREGRRGRERDRERGRGANENHEDLENL